MAGDASIQAEIFKQLHKDIQAEIVAEPEKWVSVKDVASAYCKKYRELLRERAEASILFPLGLDFPSFFAQQTTMDAQVVASIVEKLTSFDFDTLNEAIFLGIDTDGPVGPKGELYRYPQLYVTTGDKISCLNTVGFAAIGIGKPHAESQLMVYGHWPLKPFDETILLVYAAKKRAEVAPGVGKETDVMVVGPALGEHFKVSDGRIAEIDLIYQKSQVGANAGFEEAKKEIKELVERAKREQAVKDAAEAAKKTTQEPAPKKTHKQRSNSKTSTD